MNYTWRAIYDDGSELCQFNKDGLENKYTDINRDKLIQFTLWNKDTPILVVHLDGYKRLIYRKRYAVIAFGKRRGQKTLVHIVGWQQTKEGQNTQMICFVFEDGHIEVVDRFYENHPWFYSIIFMDIEKE